MEQDCLKANVAIVTQQGLQLASFMESKFTHKPDLLSYPSGTNIIAARGESYNK